MVALTLIFPVLLLCFGVVCYLYVTRHFKYWKKRGIEFIPPYPGVGNMGAVFLQKIALYDRIKEIHLSSKQRFTGFFLLDKPALLVRDLDLMKQIFVKDFTYFVDRDFAPDRKAEPIIAHGLFGLKGQEWRNLRIRLTPSFSSGKMKNMFYLIRDCCNNLETVLECYAGSTEPIDVKETMSRFTTDAISTCAFGIKGQALENPDWILRKICVQTANPNMWSSVKSVLLLVSPWIISFFGLAVHPTSLYNTLREVIWKTIKERETSTVQRNDFLDILLDIRKTTIEEKKSDPSVLVMDGDILCAQTFTFLIAGFETSSTTISLALYELAQNPDVQEKARKEIRRVLDAYNGELSYDSLQDMKYLGQIFNETLRKYPVLPANDRLCTRNYKVPDSDLIIEKGTRVFFSMLSIQNDPNNFADPDKFDPDRFSDENVNSYHKFSFLPFGEGPRNCIGMRFGTMQSKAGLVQVLKNYRVEPCATTPFPPRYSKFNVALSVTGGIPLSITRVK